MTNAARTRAERVELERARRKKGVLTFVRDIVIIVLAALLISFLIKTFLIRSFYIPSGSMEDTLLVNDRIIVNELEPGLMPIHHGDVVVFTDPGGWLTQENPVTPAPRSWLQEAVDGVLSFVGLSAPDSDDHLIKRVIGLPGDHVTCCNEFGQLTLNGVPLDEPYIKVPPGAPADGTTFDVTVPKGKLWVLGDNRDLSADSAYHHKQNAPGGGFVPIDDVVGRAVLISWPIDRWTWLSNYPLTFKGVDEK